MSGCLPSPSAVLKVGLSSSKASWVRLATVRTGQNIMPKHYSLSFCWGRFISFWESNPSMAGRKILWKPSLSLLSSWRERKHKEYEPQEVAQSGLFMGIESKVCVTHRKTETAIGMFFRTKTEINLESILFRLVEILLWQSILSD